MHPGSTWSRNVRREVWPLCTEGAGNGTENPSRVYKVLNHRFHFVISHCFKGAREAERRSRPPKKKKKMRLVAATVCNEVTDDSAETTPTSLSSVLSFVSGI